MTSESREPDARAWWPDYIEEMKGEHSEQFLAGDIEGYRRGWTDGAESTPSGATIALIAVLSAIGGFVVGLAVFFF